MTAPGAQLEAWFVRHVETEGNGAGTLQGWSDTAITAAGAQQLAALGELFAAPGVPKFDRLVASDLGRAAETARAIGNALGMRPAADPRLREAHYGDLEGQPARAAWDMQSGHPGDPFDIVLPGGESLHQMSDRVWDCVMDCLREPSLDRVLFVTHGGPISSVLARALGIAYSPHSTRLIRRDNAAVTVLRYRDEPPMTTRVVTVNATQHLW